MPLTGYVTIKAKNKKQNPKLLCHFEKLLENTERNFPIATQMKPRLPKIILHQKKPQQKQNQTPKRGKNLLFLYK